MVLSIDTSRALRTPNQVLSLIQAVFEAAPEDESRSIEWKSAYTDLTSTEASFAISRAILGLANRPVAVAAASFEGVGYVLVGVEPGSLEGQQVPDSAELLNAIHRYTGHGWPYWDARTLTFNAVTVLVVTVEPPRDGDRMALLQKSYQPAKGPLVSEGTIFVRRPGATERASRAELEMLQDRLLSGSEAEGTALREATRKSELEKLSQTSCKPGTAGQTQCRSWSCRALATSGSSATGPNGWTPIAAERRLRMLSRWIAIFGSFGSTPAKTRLSCPRWRHSRGFEAARHSLSFIPIAGVVRTIGFPPTRR